MENDSSQWAWLTIIGLLFFISLFAGDATYHLNNTSSAENLKEYKTDFVELNKRLENIEKTLEYKNREGEK